MQDTLFTHNRTFFNVASSRLIPSGYPAGCGVVARQLLPFSAIQLLMSFTLTCLPANPRQVTRIKKPARYCDCFAKNSTRRVIPSVNNWPANRIFPVLSQPVVFVLPCCIVVDFLYIFNTIIQSQSSSVKIILSKHNNFY